MIFAFVLWMFGAVSAHADTVLDIMGGTGDPNPETPAWIYDADLNYATTVGDGWSRVKVVITPEQLFPFTGLDSKTLSQSEHAGVADLNSALAEQLSAGDRVDVLGVSQSADISSTEMTLLDPQGTPSDLPISFVLIGDEENPNGGLFTRFPGADVLGVQFGDTPTPSDDFPTVVITHEYDGFADFCQYPADLVCDLNALAGVFYDHYYPGNDLGDAVRLATQGPTETTYYMIPATLPLEQLLDRLPAVGPLLEEALGPDLTALVDFGYGDPAYGWSLSPANLPTPAELIPPLDDWEALAPALVAGTQDAIQVIAEALLAW